MEQTELPAKDVFTLLSLPVPDNLETIVGQDDGNDDAGDNESLYSVNAEDQIPIRVSITFFFLNGSCVLHIFYRIEIYL